MTGLTGSSFICVLSSASFVRGLSGEISVPSLLPLTTALLISETNYVKWAGLTLLFIFRLSPFNLHFSFSLRSLRLCVRKRICLAKQPHSFIITTNLSHFIYCQRASHFYPTVCVAGPYYYRANRERRRKCPH